MRLVDPGKFDRKLTAAGVHHQLAIALGADHALDIDRHSTSNNKSLYVQLQARRATPRPDRSSD